MSHQAPLAAIPHDGAKRDFDDRLTTTALRRGRYAPHGSGWSGLNRTAQTAKTLGTPRGLPAIVDTIVLVSSRPLLFGYSDWHSMWVMHVGLLGYDALVMRASVPRLPAWTVWRRFEPGRAPRGRSGTISPPTAR